MHTTPVYSAKFQSRQGVGIRIDYMFDKPDDDQVFYAGIYVDAPDWTLYSDSKVVAVLINLDPDGKIEREIPLRYFGRVGNRIIYAAPVNGMIDARFDNQIAVVINNEWQEDYWQPGIYHNFNFRWKDKVSP